MSEVVAICDHLTKMEPKATLNRMYIMDSPITFEVVRRILTIRGQRVMLDADLAALYGVSTKRLNQQVSRNSDRFPSEFMFRLTTQERAEVVANCNHLSGLKFSAHMPHAFTEHGVLMAASVLNTPVAVHTSIQVVKAFIRLRAIVLENKDLAARLDALEGKYDRQFKVVFAAVRRLLEAPEPPAKKIGFRP
jgi:hypothetical protein